MILPTSDDTKKIATDHLAMLYGQTTRDYSRTTAPTPQAILCKVPLVKLMLSAPTVRRPFVLRCLENARPEGWIIGRWIAPVVLGLTFELAGGLE